jgi:hypothetical protein
MYLGVWCTCARRKILKLRLTAVVGPPNGTEESDFDATDEIEVTKNCTQLVETSRIENTLTNFINL